MSKLDELIAELCPEGVEYKTVDEICNVSRGRVMSKNYLRENKGKYPVYSSQTANNGVFGYINTFDYDCESITWTTDGANAGSVFYHCDEKFSITNVCGLLCVNSSMIITKFIYYVLQITAQSYVNSGMGNPKLMSNVVSKVPIPIPPLPIQQEIVRILDKFTALKLELETELEARKKQYEYYRDELFTFSDDVERKMLGEIGRVSMCKRIYKEQTQSAGDIPFYKIGTFGKEPDSFISQDVFDEYKEKYSYPKKGDVLISAAGTIGRAVIFDGTPSYFQDSNIVWIDNDEKIVLNKYLYYYYSVAKWAVSEGGTIARLYNDNINKTPVPVPPLKEQERIVTILDRFDALVNDITEGLPAEIAARRQQYEYYLDKLMTFKEAVS